MAEGSIRPVGTPDLSRPLHMVMASNLVASLLLVAMPFAPSSKRNLIAMASNPIADILSPYDLLEMGLTKGSLGALLAGSGSKVAQKDGR